MARDHKPSRAYDRLTAIIDHRPPTESRPTKSDETTSLLAAQRDQRQRIAQELDEKLLEGFTSVALKLDALTNSLPPEFSSAKEQLQKILENTDEYLAEARRSIWKLHSGTLENTDPL